MNPITPTVGRVVLVRSDDYGRTGAGRDIEVPALITAVHSDTCINAMVMRDGWGSTPTCVTSIGYHEGETTTSGGTTWRWMPYQLATAPAKDAAAIAPPPPLPEPSEWENRRAEALHAAIHARAGRSDGGSILKLAGEFHDFMAGAPPVPAREAFTAAQSDAACVVTGIDRDSMSYWKSTPQPSGFSFSAALHMLKDGHRVARAGWNGKGMFLYLVPANSYPAQTAAAKAHFGDMVPYGAYIAMKTAAGNVVPWLASQTDLIDEDWVALSEQTEGQTENVGAS